MKVSGQKSYKITLQEDARSLGDVVVTALGIKKERKALGYSVTDVKADELMKNKNGLYYKLYMSQYDFLKK